MTHNMAMLLNLREIPHIQKKCCYKMMRYGLHDLYQNKINKLINLWKQ